ncbi:DUF924 domain-containing protein [Sphingomonas sp. SUN019]|uniref:DUF924 family protein n=1 Tax=Sphingomonas sp. SUN019 TaxID=2937788 RepID=UPI002164A872|nr:DUF924 family protein [Sphingomonas sp. SUN019]UVO52235.1 DUF924 domain-containing protein [Sphingomonas sp. SUN019]
MASDLGMTDSEVHAQARAVLDFWFGLTEEQHFAKDAALDREITTRFGKLRDEVFENDAKDWSDDPDTLLAAIILLDQFSRNIHRDTLRAFEADDLAVSLTLLAIDRGWDVRLPPDRRAFVYMPLMHAEDAPLQALSVTKLEQLGIANNLKFARDHAAVIERFGRYPSRNAALGRISTPDELDYLSQPDAGW